LALFVPWARLPSWTQALPPFAYLIVVVLLRDAGGGILSPYDPLAAIPVAWFALYGTRAELWLAIVAMAATLALPVLVIGAPEYDPDQLLGASMGVLLAIVLGTTIHALLAAMRGLAAEQRFRRAFESMRVGMAIVSAEGRFISVNGALSAITGYRDRELVGKRFADITHPDDVATDLGALRELIEGKRPSYRTEKRYLHADGHTVWVAINVSPVRNQDGTLAYMITQIDDITERKQVEATLTHQALHDPLTGLPNRVLFVDRVRVASTRRDSGSFAIMYIDLDAFKSINDTLGHAAGDHVLVDVARRLEHLLREGDTLARLGGDEFAILCEGVGEDTGGMVAERVVDSFSKPFEIGDRERDQAASVGVAIQHRDGRQVDPEAVIRNADRAMYQAKARGKSRYAMFEGPVPGGESEQGLERELRRALSEGELTVHYQPEVDLGSGSISGAEALVRWQHPERGLLEPAEFMYVAETSNLIVEIDAFVMDQACRQAAAWRAAMVGEPELTVSVNVSERHLGEPELSNRIAQLLADTGLPTSSLRLEVPERAVMERRRDALAAIPDLEALGIRMLIDDFGVAVSWFSTITRLAQLDGIKIDASFIAGLGRSDEDSTGVAAMIGLAHGLNLTVIAEGVETPDQLAQLVSMGCDHAQGFYFARPQPPGAFSELLKSARYGELLA
jgi:diguanylate cyclase (GGDEF)-like protein/PAS domain S-box-containing protein